MGDQSLPLFSLSMKHLHTDLCQKPNQIKKNKTKSNLQVCEAVHSISKLTISCINSIAITFSIFEEGQKFFNMFIIF